MPTTTIEIPADHVDAIRRSLLGRRDTAERPEEIDSLLRQLGADPTDRAGPVELTGPRPVLWSAVYDSLCAAAERLADDCNEYWRGDIAPESARAAVARVDARLELLLGLGPPSAG